METNNPIMKIVATEGEATQKGERGTHLYSNGREAPKISQHWSLEGMELYYMKCVTTAASQVILIIIFLRQVAPEHTPSKSFIVWRRSRSNRMIQ